VRAALEQLAEQGARRNRLLAVLAAAIIAAVLAQVLLRF
jgi:hypothetical protein